MKPQISKNYAHLCAQKVKFTDSLFGDDVTKQIKDITDDNKVTHKLLDDNRSWHRASHANWGSGSIGVVQVFEGHPFEDEVQPTVIF